MGEHPTLVVNMPMSTRFHKCKLYCQCPSSCVCVYRIHLSVCCKFSTFCAYAFEAEPGNTLAFNQVIALIKNISQMQCSA